MCGKDKGDRVILKRIFDRGMANTGKVLLTAFNQASYPSAVHPYPCRR